MARPKKTGLDFFYMDINKDQEVKILVGLFGGDGYMTLFELYSSIYDKGYFLQWDDKTRILFANEWLNNDRDKLDAIVEECLKWGLFNKRLYDTYGILTSRRIQEHYFSATQKRDRVKLVQEYALCDDITSGNLVYIGVDTIISKTHDGVNSPETPVYSPETPVYSGNMPQSKVKGKNNNNICSPEPDEHESENNKKIDNSFEDDFETKWGMYPVKKGKNRVKTAQRKKLAKIPNEDMARAIKSYMSSVDDPKYLMYGGKWFNGEYEDWMNGDPTPKPTTPSIPIYKKFEHPEPEMFDPLDD